MSNNQTQNKRILLIGNPHSNEAVKAFLRKLVKVLEQNFDQIYVIAGDAFSVKSNKVVPVLVKYYQGTSLIRRIINFIKIQIIITIFAIRMHGKYEYCISLPQLIIFPLLYVKLITNKKLIIYAGGRASSSVKGQLNRLWRWEKYLLYLILEFIERIAFKLADFIIVESQSAIRYLDLNLYREKIIVCPQWVDTDIFKFQRNLKDRSNNIGYIGRISREKGIMEFIQSIVIIDEKYGSAISFVIVGGGDFETEILNFASKFTSITFRKMKFLGWVPHEMIANILNNLKIIVLPSYSEGLPNIVLEAMACGTPVLATPVGAISDIIKDNETGFLLKSNDPKHIADRIIELLNRPELLEKVSINAYNYVRENFSYEKTLQMWRKILKELEAQK